MKKTWMVLAPLLSLVASLALAAGDHEEGQNNRWQSEQRHDQWHEHMHDRRDVSAPEIDPGQAMGALVLLGGTVAIIRGYRRKK